MIEIEKMLENMIHISHTIDWDSQDVSTFAKNKNKKNFNLIGLHGSSLSHYAKCLI